MANKGAYVNGFTISDMRDIYELRGILESQCVRWSIERITPAELEALERQYEFLELYTKRGDNAKLKALDADFHGIIYEASQSRFLIETLRLFQKYAQSSKLVKAYKTSEIETIFAEHAAIFEAFIAQDPDMGEHAMRVHIANATTRARL